MTEGPSLPSTFNLVRFDTVTSTNDEARKLAREGAEEGTIVWALEQTAGRGRRGRVWNSPPGNLYISLILRPEVPLSEAAQIGFVAAIAVVDSIGLLCELGQHAQTKWPNDVLLNGMKLAGMLLETESEAGSGEPEWVVLGLGVNLAHYPDDAEFPATSLRAERQMITDAQFLEAFCRKFAEWIGRWTNEGFGVIRKNWLWRAAGLGQKIQVRLENETLDGIFKDLDEDGALVLDQDGTERRITAGSVFFPGGA
jgi:BirA family biotin operon repressor/biotin-[acetyl-CoA-carboxylase] ligase